MEYAGFDSEKGARKGSVDADAARKQSIAAMMQNTTGEIKNPLVGIPKDELFANVQEFAEKGDMVEYVELLRKGALIAQNPADFENIAELDESDREAIRNEITHRWRHPFPL